MPNRLRSSTSPYLLAHAENPVDWYPWGPEAFSKAQTENKPIFLSIGYSACHWCHVMEKESFQDPKIADILNKLFVNIKVDREERPDIDAIYMKSVVLMTGGGGWPTSVWLTPDLKPFYGGTYFPPTPRRGQPSLAQVLLSLASSWKNKREEILSSAEQLIHAVGQLSEIAAPLETSEQNLLEDAEKVCLAQQDPTHGGFGKAPKFPQGMTLRFLLLRAVKTGNAQLAQTVHQACEAMARGGLYDQLGGGFHRYCVDAAWTVPHFEKMLYDNAVLLGLYSDLVAYSGQPIYRQVVETLVGWLEREMALPHGGFASSTDADSQGEEGTFFTWTPSALAQILEPDELQLFLAYYGVTEEGNFEGGLSVLSQKRDLTEVATELGWSEEKARTVLLSARHKTLEARSLRPTPARDDKAVASWNAQTVSALCRAARQVGVTQAQKLALKAGAFLKDHFVVGEGDQLRRVVMGTEAQGIAQAEDIGSLVLAFFDLYELTLDDQWLKAALPLYSRLLADHWDDSRGLTAMTAPTVDDIPLRPYSFEDNATPSAHSLLLECARRHHRLTGEPVSAALWDKAMASVSSLAQRAPTGVGLALQSAALQQGTSQELVVAGPREQALPFLETLQGRFLPNLLIAHAESSQLAAELRQGKEGGAYLCSGTSCQPPTADPTELAGQLSKLNAL